MKFQQKYFFKSFNKIRLCISLKGDIYDYYRIEEVEESKLKAEKAQQEQEKENQKQTEEAQRRSIQDALNKQTFSQFRSYAEQQYPSNPDQQAVLVKQLQEQHYYQVNINLIHIFSAPSLFTYMPGNQFIGCPVVQLVIVSLLVYVYSDINKSLKF